MPQIKVKTEYINKMMRLDCYDKWLANVKWQYAEWRIIYAYADDKIYTGDFTTFIHFSFQWDKTPEGKPFWQNIADC